MRSLEKISNENVKEDLFKKFTLKNFDEQVLSSLTCYESVSPKLERAQPFLNNNQTKTNNNNNNSISPKAVNDNTNKEKTKEAKLQANMDMPRSIKVSPLREANQEKLRDHGIIG